MSYLGATSMPQAAFAESHLQQQLGDLRVRHLRDENVMLRSLHSLNPKLLYQRPASIVRTSVLDFSDAAESGTYEQGGYVSGLCVEEIGGLVLYLVTDWHIASLKLVAFSSTGAEILAAANAADRGFALSEILREFAHEPESLLFELTVDSRGTLDTMATLHEGKDFRELDRLGLHLDAKWLPSALNKYADALSRRFPRGDRQIRRSLRRSVMAGMQAPADVFPYRPLGEHPVFLRRQSFQEMANTWSLTDKTRLLCPPTELISPILQKVRLSGCPAILLIPDWPHQAWHATALRMATHVFRCPEPPDQVWDARTLNPRWRLLLVELNMPTDTESWSRQNDLLRHFLQTSPPAEPNTGVL
jgi:hypothetical protein